MDIPLQFHEFYHLNHTEKCPKYTEILHKADSIVPNEIHALYTDLETLQGASNIRLRRLEEEVKILTEWCDKKDRVKTESELDFLSNVTTSKRSRTGGNEEARTSKKQKIEEPSKASSSRMRNKGKVTGEANDSDAYTTTKPRLTYDASNKFWGYVEPYCSDVTPEDIKTLEDSLTSKADITEYFKIPPLGKYYSEVWAKEDFVEEQQQVNKFDKKRSSQPGSVNTVESKFTNIDVNNMQVDSDEYCTYGTFTQRLVSALVDENIMAPVTETELHDVIVDSVPKTDVKSSSKKIVGTATTKSLEAAIREELFALGLIESSAEDDAEFDAEDEILTELRKCQSELKVLRSHNKHAINKLIARARFAMKKQEVRQKAKVLDAEVLDIFRRFTSSKARKKGFPRKDRELAWKSIREREALWKLADSKDTTEK